MKKFLAILAVLPFIFALSFISTGQPKANAASIDTGRLLEFMSSEETTATIQEIVKAGTEIKQGNTKELKTAVFKRALEQAGISGQVNELIIDNIQNKGANSKNISKELAKKVEDTLKIQLKSHLNERLSPHQEKILILAALLNLQDELTPKTVKGNASK